MTPWTVACQAPLSMKFSRQEYWSGLPFPSTRDLPNPGIEPRSPALQADSLPSELPGKPRDQTRIFYVSCISRRVFFLLLAPPGKPILTLHTACQILFHFTPLLFPTSFDFL